MTRIKWKADEELRRTSIRNLAEYDVSKEGVNLNLLDLLGTLSLSGCQDDAQEWVAGRDRDALSTKAQSCLGELDGQDLDEAVTTLAFLLPRLRQTDMDADDWASLEEQVIECIAVRDQMEVVLAGARLILGEEADFGDDAGSSLDAFDDWLEQELWMTLPLGPRRAALCAWVDPEYRSNFWWWLRGVELPATSLVALETAAQIIHTFPQAREELERLVGDERVISSLTSPATSHENGISIIDWVQSKSSTEVLAVAAAEGTGHRKLYQDDNLYISAISTSILVDCEVQWDKSGEPVASISAPGYPDLAGKETPGFNGRFEFPLDAPQMSVPGAQMKIRFKHGVTTLSFPPPSED